MVGGLRGADAPVLAHQVVSRTRVDPTDSRHVQGCSDAESRATNVVLRCEEHHSRQDRSAMGEGRVARNEPDFVRYSDQRQKKPYRKVATWHNLIVRGPASNTTTTFARETFSSTTHPRVAQAAKMFLGDVLTLCGHTAACKSRSTDGMLSDWGDRHRVRKWFV